MAPLAEAARRLGHDVMVASGPDLAAWASRCGFASCPVGLTQPELAQAAQAAYPDDWPGHLFTDVWVPTALPGLLEIARSWRPQVVVHEEEEYAALLLGALVGVPVVTHSWHAPVRPPEGRAEAGELLAPLWTTHCPGVAVRTTGCLYLDACPPPFQTGQIAELDNVVQVQPVPYDGVADDLPPWLERLARPAIYVTLGTVPTFSTPARLRDVVLAVAPLAASVVVTTGPNPVDSLGELPANVWATPYLPQSQVLGKVDLVVSQGGAGGTLGAIEHGLPHLVLPFHSQSQQASAAAVERLGAGRLLAEDQRDELSIRQAAAELLDHSSFRKRAEQLRSQLRGLPSPEEVVDLVSATVGEG